MELVIVVVDVVVSCEDGLPDNVVLMSSGKSKLNSGVVFVVASVVIITIVPVGTTAVGDYHNLIVSRNLKTE